MRRSDSVNGFTVMPMDTIQKIQEIRDLLAEGNLEEAVDAFMRFSQLHQQDNLSDYALHISSRFARLRSGQIKGTITAEEYNVEYSKLTQSISEKLKDVEKEFTVSRPASKIKKGKIIHNIPGQMSKGVRYTCTIRLAPEDELLLRGFPLRAESKVEDIDELTEIMSVELLDESGGEMFEIKPVNRSSEQVIVDHSFTQWKFNVTALAEGQGCLILTVYAVYKVDGKTVQREIPYERVINVESYQEDFLIENPVTYWEDTGMTIEELRARNKFSILAGLAAMPAAAKAFLAVSLVVVSLVVGYQFIKPDLIQPVLQLDGNVETILAVRVNGEPIEGWTEQKSNSLISQITLPAVKATELYEFEVVGARGTCKVRTTAHLSRETVIELPCQFIPVEQELEPMFEEEAEEEIPEPEPEAPEPDPSPGVVRERTPVSPPPTEVSPPPSSNRPVKVRIVTPFQNPLLYANNAAQKPLGASTAQNKRYVTEYEVSPGTYRLDVRAPGQASDTELRCNSILSRSIHRDTELEFDCPAYHKLTIRSNASSIKLELDGTLVSRAARRESGSGSEHDYWLPASSKTYKIQVTDISNESVCKGEQSIVMNQPRVLRYQCAPLINTHKITVTVSMPADYNLQGLRLLVLGSGGFRREVKEAKTLQSNSLKIRKISYEVPDLPSGTYNFRVVFLDEREEYCTIENRRITSDTNLECSAGDIR
jgi:hypothetical protein